MASNLMGPATREAIGLKGSRTVTRALEIRNALGGSSPISLRITDDSFAPVVIKDDRIRVIKFDPHKARKGDLVLLFLKEDIIVRRLESVQRCSPPRYNLSGDASGNEMTVPGTQILGRVIGVRRGDRNMPLVSPATGLLSLDLGQLISGFLKKR